MTLYTISSGPTPPLIEEMLSVWFPDAETILDTTYGNGAFWKGSSRQVIGMDLNPQRARSVCGTFTALPFKTNSGDLVVFDPPYHTDMGKGKPSVMGDRFGTYATMRDLHDAVREGASECYRVARLGILVKVQNYIHASELVPMTDWVLGSIPLPLYDEVHHSRTHKIVDPKWGTQLSAYRNHATFLAFRVGSQKHVRRGAKRGGDRHEEVPEMREADEQRPQVLVEQVF